MAKEKKRGSVNLYGEINSWGDNSAAAFIARFNEAAKEAGEMNVYVHTYGGDVLEGTLIYNHIKASTIPVNMHIVGVCCSMGTILMMAATKVWMCENSYLMIHAPKGGCYGTAAELEKAAKLLRGIEKNFKKIYATKTGRDENGVKELLEGDNWFTAQEAAEAKLIDGIVAPIATGVTQVSAEELQSQTPSALYNRFSACLKTGEEATACNNNQLNESEMDKEGLIKRFGLTGVTAQSTDKEIEDAIAAKMDEEKQRADTAEQAMASAKKKQITDAVTAAVDAKKITAEQKEVFIGIGEKSGYEALASALDAIKPVPGLAAATRSGGTASTAAVVRADWTWEQWQKEDPRGLEVLAKEDPERFEALYNGSFK
ncbi:head maturation protease, ClpP-related [Bacteroides sp.]